MVKRFIKDALGRKPFSSFAYTLEWFKRAVGVGFFSAHAYIGAADSENTLGSAAPGVHESRRDKNSGVCSIMAEEKQGEGKRRTDGSDIGALRFLDAPEASARTAGCHQRCCRSSCRSVCSHHTCLWTPRLFLTSMHNAANRDGQTSRRMSRLPGDHPPGTDSGRMTRTRVPCPGALRI
jgi:hypothetical protein